MNILSLFSFVVYAAESVISPLPGDYQPPVAQPAKPMVSFSELPLPSPSPHPKDDQPLAETLIPTSTPSPTPSPDRSTKTPTVTIALLGDSMMDTLGSDAPHLVHALHATYPKTTVVVKNLGVGGEPIDSGIERITNGYTYLGSSYPSLTALRPDVVVLESFGYNPTGEDQGAIDRHWLALARAVDAIRTNLPGTPIVIAATIAPNAQRFGDGAPGIAFSTEEKLARTATIKKYIENAIKFSRSQGLPLANAYGASMDASGNGKLVYINGGDHIHYSDAGRALMASKIAGAIAGNKLLE